MIHSNDDHPESKEMHGRASKVIHCLHEHATRGEGGGGADPTIVEIPRAI